MTQVVTLPFTVDGIKRLAKSIKRESNIPHNEALNEAAKRAGFQNFRHAQNQLSGSAPRRHKLYLSVLWSISRGEKAHNDRRYGRELLEMEVSKPLSELIARHQVDSARNLYKFRMEYRDHLERITDCSSFEDARQELDRAARTIRFIEATGLAPVTNGKGRAKVREATKVPGHDHISEWLDPVSGEGLVLNEPYEDAEGIPDKVQVWANITGMHVARPSTWRGLYAPNLSEPFLISKSKELVHRVLAAVEALPVNERRNWAETGTYGELFVSPAREEEGKKRKNRPGPSYMAERMGAVPYGGTPGIPSRWRPAITMPIDQHRKLGALLGSLRGVGLPYMATKKLGICRSALEDWSYLEHKGEERCDDFDELYYGRHCDSAYGRDATIAAVANVRTILLAGYNDCIPRKKMVNDLDKVLKMLSEVPDNTFR